MENDLYAILASLPDEKHVAQLFHAELLKAYCVLYRFTSGASGCGHAKSVGFFANKGEQLQEVNNELRRKLNINSDTAGIPPFKDALRNERREARKK